MHETHIRCKCNVQPNSRDQANAVNLTFITLPWQNQWGMHNMVSCDKQLSQRKVKCNKPREKAYYKNQTENSQAEKVFFKNLPFLRI